MIRQSIKKIGLVLTAVILLTAGIGHAEYDYIDISNPFLRKIPVAVPVFKAITGADGEIELSIKAADLLSSALAFTGYFKTLDRGAFLINPEEFGLVGPSIKFENWTSIGAELLVTGGLTVKDKIIEMEIRIFDTFKQKLLIGKKYKGWINDQRRMIHRFCSEVIYRFTNTRGVFDTKLAFISTGDGSKEIYFCDFDGYNPKRFTHNKSITLSPSWSSDGKWMAYTSYVKGKPDLYIRHIKEKRGTVVSKKGLNSSPAWVPGKFALAASLSFSGDPEIYLLTGNGKIIKRLTHSRGIDVSPAWSPDGKKMAFVSKRSGSPQIHIMDLDSGRVKRLTFQGKYNTQPEWSPKGDKIAYSAMENGEINIYVVDTEGNHPVQLTHGTGNNESPSWSPDGSLITFSSTREGPARIYMMNAFGTDQRRLLVMPGQQTNPNWSPWTSRY